MNVGAREIVGERLPRRTLIDEEDNYKYGELTTTSATTPKVSHMIPGSKCSTRMSVYSRVRRCPAASKFEGSAKHLKDCKFICQ